jgi:hypothetical protein
MAAYKHGGDVHKAVKEKSMHHLATHEAKHRKTGGRADDGEENADDDSEGDSRAPRGWKMKEPDTEEVYAGKGSNVDKEARGEERKKGGKVKKVARKTGGKAEEKKKHLGHIEGEEKKHRLDRPGRKRGGGVGSDTSPLTTANKTSERRGPTDADNDRGITGEE